MPASLFEAADRPKAEAFCRLTWCNPFHEDRGTLERQALGDAWRAPTGGMEWEGGFPVAASNPNTETLVPLSKRLVNEARERLRRRTPTANERTTYRDLVIFALFYQFVDEFHKMIRQARERGSATQRCGFYDRYRAGWSGIVRRTSRPCGWICRRNGCLPHFFRFAAPMRTFTNASSAPRQRRGGCGRGSGSPSSPGIWHGLNGRWWARWGI